MYSCVSTSKNEKLLDFCLFFFSSLFILCDLSLVVTLTHDFVIDTQGPVSCKHTLFTHCLYVFPVCIISATCALKLWRPLLRNSSQNRLHSTSTPLSQGLKWRLEDSSYIVFSLSKCSYNHTDTHTQTHKSCRAKEYLHESSHSTPLHHMCYSNSLLCTVTFPLHRKGSTVTLQERKLLVERRGKELQRSCNNLFPNKISSVFSLFLYSSPCRPPVTHFSVCCCPLHPNCNDISDICVFVALFC